MYVLISDRTRARTKEKHNFLYYSVQYIIDLNTAFYYIQYCYIGLVVVTV